MQTQHTSGNAALDATHLNPAAPQVTASDANQTGPKEGETNKPKDEQSSLEKLEKTFKNAYSELNAFGPKTLPIAIRLGKILASLKTQIKHGQWAVYANETLKISPRSASDYVLLSKHCEELKSAKFADYGLVEALNYFRRKKDSPPAEKFQFILADGRKITWKDGAITREPVKEIIDRYAPASQEVLAKKQAALRQESVIRIASTANLVSKESEPDLVGEALKVVEDLLVSVENRVPA